MLFEILDSPGNCLVHVYWICIHQGIYSDKRLNLDRHNRPPDEAWDSLAHPRAERKPKRVPAT